ncbi:MAG: hypothetical protein PHD67_06620 [Oscillospiraceae bacterium]|nr:hypothetical protein [Oscillospiraceae bacterium]
MHFVIISASPRARAKSNTEKILRRFLEGFEGAGGTAEVWYLAERGQWPKAREAFEQNEHILFALPLFVENIPGVMLEFLEGLPPKREPGTKVAFLLQGGFPEASQLRCGERYLKSLPARFGCECAGILIKGDMFGVRLMGDKLGEKMTEPFVEAGRLFVGTGGFPQDAARAFAGPEYMPQAEIKRFHRLGRHLQKFFMGQVAKKLGCKGKLDAQPYLSEVGSVKEGGSRDGTQQ